MKICVYSNCQGDGIAHFIRKVHPTWEIRVHHNWQIMLGETSGLAMVQDAKWWCDIFVYQPTDAFKDAPSTNDIIKDLGKARPISFPYCYNTGFFPIVKSGTFWTGNEIIKLAMRGSPLVEMWDNDEFLIYDCARRFAENVAEQSRREECCTLQFVPFILQNFQTKHLFLLHNHPASPLFVEMARAVLRAIDPKFDVEIPYDGPNDANLPGYHGVHPAVIRELGLRYTPDRRGEDMDYYRVLIQELAATKGML